MNPLQKAEQYASSQYDVNQYTEPDSVKGTGWTDCRDAWLAGYEADRWIPVTTEAIISLIDTEVLLWDREGWALAEHIDKDAIEWYCKHFTHYQLITPPKTPTL